MQLNVQLFILGFAIKHHKSDYTGKQALVLTSHDIFMDTLFVSEAHSLT